nr:reverse transcriptase domain-containing protein [Tanacetum cinerariifolium]
MMASFFQMNTTSTLGSGPLPSNTIGNPKGELKSITTLSGLVLDGPSIAMPPPFINPEEDERVAETLTDPKLDEFTIKKMLKALLSNKEKLLELANTPSMKIAQRKLKCKAQADLANRTICTLSGIARDVFVPVGKFTFPADFVIVYYENDPRVPLILGRPFLRIAHAFIDVHGEEMILRDGDERLTLNIRHDTSSYSNQPQKESINMINIYDDSCKDFLKDLFATNHLSGNPTFSSHTDLTSSEVKDDIFDPEGNIVIIAKLLNLDSTKDLPPPYNIHPLNGSTTSSSPNYLLEEFTDELDLVDEDNIADPNDNLVDTIPEMFTDKHALDCSSPPLYDDFYDDLDEFESDVVDVYNDPFDSKGEKIKESKLLIDELDLPRSNDFLPSLEYDLFLFEDFSEVDALPLTNNGDKVFNPGILIHENLSEITTRVAPNKNIKKIAISHASFILEDFNPSLYELPFDKEVPEFETLLSFSSKNEEKVFKPGILTSKGVHTSLLQELSHQGPKAFKVIKIFESPMEIFPCSYREEIRILDVSCLYFYPL